MHGRGRGFRIAKNQFQKDFRRRPNEEAALTELRQLHSRIGDAEAVQPAAHSVMIGKGIRVNAVSPGNTYFEGGIWQNIERGMPDLYKTAMSLNPTGRMGTPQEVAAGVVFIASPVASRISGTNLIIDGALTKAV